MKLFKIIIAAAVVVTAGVLVWHLMWMQEMDSRHDAKQMIKEAQQLGDKRDESAPAVSAGRIRSETSYKEKNDQVMPDVSEKKKVEQPPQKSMEEVRAAVESLTESKTEKEPSGITQAEEEIDYNEPVENTDIPDKEATNLKTDPDSPLMITIKGTPLSKSKRKSISKVIHKSSTIKKTVRNNPAPPNNPVPVTNHPTSTSP